MAGSAYPPVRKPPKRHSLCVGESREEHHKQLELSPTTLEIPNKSILNYYNTFKEIDKVIVALLVKEIDKVIVDFSQGNGQQGNSIN